MEVGGQFDDACAHSAFNAYRCASCQTIHITQFGIGDDGIVGSQSDRHGLASQIPCAVSFDIHGCGAQRKHHRSCQ